MDVTWKLVTQEARAQTPVTHAPVHGTRQPRLRVDLMAAGTFLLPEGGAEAAASSADRNTVLQSSPPGRLTNPSE